MPAKAGRLRAKARKLFERFNEAFWDEASGFYAFCLDGDKKPVLSVASNPGHCLMSGIVPPERAGRVVERLMAPDMSSGWGIRTLSSEHPAYNPHSYQNGSVWPHDNGLIAARAFAATASTPRRCRSRAHISDAASYFAASPRARALRRACRAPTQLPGALQGRQRAAGLGGRLMLQHPAGDTRLPSRRAARQALRRSRSCPTGCPIWSLIDLQVGKAMLDMRLWREGEATRWEVTRGPKNMVEQRRFARMTELWPATNSETQKATTAA